MNGIRNRKPLEWFGILGMVSKEVLRGGGVVVVDITGENQLEIDRWPFFMFGSSLGRGYVSSNFWRRGGGVGGFVNETFFQSSLFKSPRPDKEIWAEYVSTMF